MPMTLAEAAGTASGASPTPSAPTGPMTLAQAAAASNGGTNHPASGGGGFIGGLLGHLPHLGLANFVHQVGGIPYGLAALATGKGGYGHVWSAAGKGLASSLFGTVESIPGVSLIDQPFNEAFAQSFGEQYRPHNFVEQYKKEGLLPAVVTTLGNVSLAGGAVGKIAEAGDIGKLAAAADAASAAEKVGFTAEDVAKAAQDLRDAGSLKEAGIANKVLRAAAKATVNADGLSASAENIASRAKLVHAASLATRPYQTIFKSARPFAQAAQAAQVAGEAAPVAEAASSAVPAAETAMQGLHDIAQSAPDAALNRTRALLGGAVHEAAGAPAAVLTPEEQIAKLSQMLPQTTVPEIADAVKSGNLGPIEDASRRAANLPVSPRVADIVSRLPEPVKAALSRIEGRIESHQTKNVVFERMRTQGAERNVDQMVGPVREGIKTASRFLVGKTLEDGTKIGPDLANRLLGDEVMARLSGVKQLEEQAASRAPEAAAAIREALVKGGDRAEQTIPAVVATDPAFEAAMQHLTTAWHGAAQERLARLQGSRLGEQGLEHVGENTPMMTKAEKAAMSDIRARTEKLGPLGRAADRQQAAVEGLIARHQATSAALNEQINQAVQGAQEAAPAAFERARGAEVTPGRSLAQEATTKLPEGVATSAHDAYRRGVVSGRQIEQAAKFGDTADQLIKRKAVLDKQVADLTKTINDYKLPGQTAKARAEAAIARRTSKLGESLDDPSLVRTPPEWQPVYAALKDLHAASLTNPALARAVEGLPERFSTVLDLAAKKGFDPAHIRSFEPGQVRRLVYGQVQLGKAGIELGKTIEAGTRKGRFIGQVKTRSLDALAAAMHEATHEDNTNALATYIEDTWAKPMPADGSVPKGWAPWDAAKRHLLTESSTGEGVNIASAHLADKMIPIQVKNTLDSFTQDYSHAAWSTIRKVTNPWKALVLTMNPGWYVNHFIGHVVGAAKEGTSIGDWAKAWSEYRRGGADLGANKLVGKVGRGADAFEGMPSVERQSFVSEMDRPQMVPFPHGNEGLKLARETGGNRDALRLFTQRYRAPIKTIDDISRAAVFNAATRRGASGVEALQHATEAFLDYQRLGPFEQQIVNSVVPFYSFQKAMMRLVVKMPLDHPVATGFLMTLSDLNQRMNQDIYGTNMPAYYENLIKLPGLGTVNIGKFNPFEHAAGALTSPQGIAGAINPFISATIRNAYGAPSYEPHNAQGQLVAPLTRLNQFGVETPATNLAADIGGAIGGVPLGRLLGSQTGSSAISGAPPTSAGQGIEKFAGVPAMTDAQLQKLLKRVMRYNTAQQPKAVTG